MSGFPLPPPRAILFDWDNTLVDNWPSIHDALNATFSAMGHELWTLEQTKERVRRSLRDSFPEMFGERWTQARDIFYARFETAHLEHLAPLPGAAEMLAALAETDLYLGVVSNKTGRYLRAEAAHLGWDRHFACLVGATDTPADKPAPEVVIRALEGSGIGPGPAVWFVGDGAIDVQCAQASGLTPVVVEGPGTRAEMARHNIDEFIPDISYIAEVSILLDLIGQASGGLAHKVGN